jgi:hypothetical protein
MERSAHKRGHRRPVFGFLLTGLVLIAAGAAAAAPCDREGSDLSAIAAARVQVAAQCDCVGAATRGAYVRCARDVVQARVDGGQLNPRCRRDVMRCARKSTCGRPGAVTCCRTSATGKTRCSIRPSAERCRAPRGGSACAGAHQSCCDACTAGGCASVCGNGIVEPGEECDGDPGCSNCRILACCEISLGSFSACSNGPGTASDCAAGGGTAWCADCICVDTGVPCPGDPFPGCTVSSCEPR